MPRPQKEPLRALGEEEQAYLTMLSRSRSAPAELVIRAKILLAVEAGSSFAAAARSVGRKDGDPVAKLVRRINEEGLEGLESRPAGRPPTQYGPVEKARILHEFKRQPDRVEDGTATWSISTLQRALREAPDGLPKVSEYTIWRTLRDAGYSWQRDRTWCNTGVVERRRKAGIVTVEDPDKEAKKNSSRRRTRRPPRKA